jgi:hypothetical protein
MVHQSTLVDLSLHEISQCDRFSLLVENNFTCGLILLQLNSTESIKSIELCKSINCEMNGVA